MSDLQHRPGDQQRYRTGSLPPQRPIGPREPPRPPSRPMRKPGLAVTVLAALVAGVLGGALTYAVLDDGPADFGSPRAEGSIAAVAQRVLPVVVTVEAYGPDGLGSGSGFVLDGQGHVLTNNHVISLAAGGGEIEVGLVDGTEASAVLVGRSTSYDLAVLRIDRTDLATAALGNSDSVQVGDTAIAIGAPLGLSETVTQGIISALHRPVTAGGVGETAFISAIQTDAAINPGNSGGPLLNGAGEVIGVNSAIATLADVAGEGGNIGLGFAIPINQAVRVAEEIIATGVSTTPVIEVALDLLYLGEGARIRDVTPGGPADAAGLRSGDVVVAVDGVDVANGNELVIALRTNAPGDEVVLTREDGTDVEVVLGSQPES